MLCTGQARVEVIPQVKQEVRQEVEQEVKAEEKLQNAKNLKMEGISLETIARCIGLPLATVEAI